MQFEYILTYDDFKDAQKVFMRRNAYAHLSFLFWLRVLPILATLSVLLLVYMSVNKHNGLPSWWATASATIFWIDFYVLVFRPIQLRWRFKQLLVKGEKNVHATIEVDDRQVVSAVPGRSETRTLLIAFCGFIEDDKMGLLLLSKKKFLLVPKRAMPEDQWQLIRDHISRSRKVA